MLRSGESLSAVGRTAQRRGLENRVVEPRCERGEPGAVGKVRNHTRAQRHTIRIMIVLLELGLELGHIHAGRALGFTGLTGQAEVHDFLDLVTIEGVLGIVRIGQDLAQDVGTGAGGVFFFTGRHVARAHGASGQRPLAAVAGAIAFLGSTDDTQGVAEIKDGFILRGPLLRAVAQRGIHRRRVHDLAGIEDVLGSKRSLTSRISW